MCNRMNPRRLWARVTSQSLSSSYSPYYRNSKKKKSGQISWVVKLSRFKIMSVFCPRLIWCTEFYSPNGVCRNFSGRRVWMKACNILICCGRRARSTSNSCRRTATMTNTRFIVTARGMRLSKRPSPVPIGGKGLVDVFGLYFVVAILFTVVTVLVRIGQFCSISLFSLLEEL